jgi:hypothetical protein
LGSIFLTFSKAKPTLVRITNVNRRKLKLLAPLPTSLSHFWG